MYVCIIAYKGVGTQNWREIQRNCHIYIPHIYIYIYICSYWNMRRCSNRQRNVSGFSLATSNFRHGIPHAQEPGMAGAAGRMLQLGNSTRVIVEVWHWRGTCFHVGVLICIYIYILFYSLYFFYFICWGKALAPSSTDFIHLRFTLDHIRRSLEIINIPMPCHTL